MGVIHTTESHEKRCDFGFRVLLPHYVLTNFTIYMSKDFQLKYFFHQGVIYIFYQFFRAIFHYVICWDENTLELL